MEGPKQGAAIFGQLSTSLNNFLPNSGRNVIFTVIALTKNLTGFAIFSILRSFRAHVHAFCVQKNLKLLVEG